jgi:hypothetical protein
VPDEYDGMEMSPMGMDGMDHYLSMDIEEHKSEGKSPSPGHKSIRDKVKDLNNMKGPPKYDNQRSPPPEIPLDIIRKLFLSIDLDLDDRISIEELAIYSEKTHMPFNEDVNVCFNLCRLLLKCSKKPPNIELLFTSTKEKIHSLLMK